MIVAVVAVAAFALYLIMFLVGIAWERNRCREIVRAYRTNRLEIWETTRLILKEIDGHE